MSDDQKKKKKFQIAPKPLFSNSSLCISSTHLNFSISSDSLRIAKSKALQKYSYPSKR